MAVRRDDEKNIQQSACDAPDHCPCGRATGHVVCHEEIRLLARELPIPAALSAGGRAARDREHAGEQAEPQAAAIERGAPAIAQADLIRPAVPGAGGRGHCGLALP
jgi:hypothetical protein